MCVIPNLKQVVLICGLLMPSLLGSVVFAQADAGKARSVIISAIANEQTHALAKEIVRVAYERIGVGVEFDDLPAQRGLEWANSGRTDGDLARIDGTDKKFVNLIKISTPVTSFKGVVFTKNIERNILSWKDLNGLSIGIIGGIRYSDIGTKGLDRVLARDMHHLFKLLEKEHIDVAVAVLDAGKIEVYQNHGGSNIHTIGQPLFEAPLFHFVHKRNKDLVPQLESVLQKMMETGEIASIRETTMNKALSQ